MKLFYAPGACSLGIHIILDEIGKPFELEAADFSGFPHQKPPYYAINPKGKVPALLLDDGSLLTEYPAIAWYLARANPTAGLLPETPQGEARVLEVLDFLIASIHMRGFTRMLRPSVFTPNTTDEPAVAQAGKDIVTAGFKLIDQSLNAKAYLLGDYTIADSALFFLCRWAVVRVQLALPDNLAAHYARMKERPAVQRALAAEGLS